MADSLKASPDIILLGEREQQLDMLLHVQEFSAMAVLITGPSSIGKTALLEAAVAQLSIHHQTIHVSAFATNQLADLIDEISTQLGCAANLVDLDKQLAQISEQQETLHLVIDDAHLLNEDVIALLLEKSAMPNGWRLILCGDESLKPRLKSLQSQFEHKLYHLIELSPLTEEESEAFISQLFKRSGIDVVPISIKDMHQLWLLSKGVPGKLIELVELEQVNRRQRTSRFPVGHIAAVCLIGSALFVSFLYQGHEADKQTDDVIAQLLQEQKDRLSSGKGAQVIAESEGLMADEMTLSIDQQPVTHKALGYETESQDNDPAVTSLPNKSVKAQPKAEILAESIPKRVETQAKPLGKIANTIAVNKASQIESSPPQVGAPSHPLLSAPSQSYALQLLGVRNEASAKAFVQRFTRQTDGSKLNIYETRYKGEPWFVVVYGPIGNKQQASKQANQLSKTLKGQPWVRPISKIQADIRQIQ
ncbi:MAG: AAA family ATPase [Bermanella sp.]